MRKNFGAKPYTYPQPVYIIATYGEDGTPDAMNAPLIRELSVAAECRLISYDADTGRLVGEIVNVSVDESVLDENGNVDVAKVAPITFDPFNNAYWTISEKAGNAFADGAALK